MPASLRTIKEVSLPIIGASWNLIEVSVTVEIS